MRKVVAGILFLIVAVGCVVIFKYYHTQKVIREKKEKAREEFLADLKPLPEIKIPGIILVAHFNERENKGPLGDFGSWDKDPNDFTPVSYTHLTLPTKA